MGDRIQRLNQVAQDGDIDAEIQRLNGIAQQGDIDAKIQRLNGIAQQGDIGAFYNIIREDVKLLEYIDKFPFVDTPLHKSAFAGHSPFSIEMMILKPSFVSKRNPNGHTPIYLALQNGHTEMVRQLLQHNADLVRVKGRECMTPLHYAATTIGREDMTTRNETALHVALKNNNLEAFKFLVGWLLRKWPYWRKILEQKDVEGNTVLHIAISRNQTLAVSHLLLWAREFVNINKKNLEGKTALDIFEGQRSQGVDNSEMRVILERAGALTASSLPTVTSYADNLIIRIRRELKGLTDERRNALLVVVALLVTVSYQAAITPPGGLWQDDLFDSNITASHRAGSAIARRTGTFAIFLVFNTIIFFYSIATMAFLIPLSEFFGVIVASISFYLCIGYLSSLMIITQAPNWLAKIVPISPLIILFILPVALKIADKGLGYNLNLVWKVLKRIYS
ncbi:hypothetical protein RGQ29_001763 [Quercus rubra]|uniref:PGG domain-containing protein n=1 Tax=Quercus rubra TaxID=3512 RepID=A0AAN7GH73_QUERU|nr:hypothetical protein RGQ29_001763 [Quercus rubra]